MKHPLYLSAPLMFVCCVCACFTPAVRGATAQSPSAPQEQQDQVVHVHEQATTTIPGPLRSFLRMAGISQKIAPEEVMPLLARNVFIIGYEGSGASGRPTEFLILLRRYVQQARELAALAGTSGVIHVTNCDDAKQLLGILGYRTRPDCGKSSTYVETEDARRAFLTIDSGFPLPELEKTLQGGAPFVYPYAPTTVPVLFAPSDWSMASRNNHVESSRDLLDTLLRDSDLARLYWA